MVAAVAVAVAATMRLLINLSTRNYIEHRVADGVDDKAVGIV